MEILFLKSFDYFFWKTIFWGFLLSIPHFVLIEIINISNFSKNVFRTYVLIFILPYFAIQNWFTLADNLLIILIIELWFFSTLILSKIIFLIINSVKYKNLNNLKSNFIETKKKLF